MKKLVYSFPLLVSISAVAALIMTGCDTAGSGKEEVPDSLAIKKDLTSPVLTAQESMKKMHIEEGFEVKLVAAEPLVTAPVSISFDDKGRIWAVEMEDYMPDTVGTGESNPTGKVVILSDKNGDGMMDDRTVFLDSLVLPRAICLIDNGLLVAESPNLWYYPINNDKPGKRTLVDPAYAEGGNVEHQPNGLLRALDNWIYNAKSSKRYRKNGDKWQIEQTHFRGQWGISQDDEGRLYYNTNSENLLGDYFSPGLGAYNEDMRSVAGYVKKIVANNRVYPVRPTPGVNRGYMEGVLDDSLRLVNFTAACGPVIYNGNLFDKSYYGNGFVAEPAGNLIKRNILHDAGYVVNGEEAYTGKEFIASEDERFRPVNLSVGPDGAIYIVDMYRGIIQHKTYLTPYLKNEIKDRNLTKPLNCGRIYKVVPRGATATAVTFTKAPDQLVTQLQHPNGWVRNEAQQLLVDGKYKEAVPLLRNNLSATNQPLTVIHSLWTLEGQHALETADVMPLLQQSSWPIRMQALSVIPSVINSRNYQQLVPVLQHMIDENDTLAAPYVGYLVHAIQPLNAQAAHELMVSLVKKYPDNVYVADAVISNLKGKEAAFYKESLGYNADTSLAINKRLQKVMEDMAKAKKNPNAKELAKRFPKGAALFQSVCQTCHGTDGNGVAALAPPLNNSNWVTGDKSKLIPIVIYGLNGPIKVAGKVYKAPEINGEMPGIGQNKEYTNEDLAQVLSYIRASWSNKAGPVQAADINNVRNKFKDRQKAFTMDELNKLK